MPARTRTPRIALGVLLTVVVLLVGVWLGGHNGWIPHGLRSTFSNQKKTTTLVQNVLDQVDRDFYRKVNTTALANRGLTAAIASLNDPYSHYYSPSAFQSFSEVTDPRDKGIGVEVNPKPTKLGLMITGILPDSPAEKAGLHAGQQIVAVGATSLAGKTVDQDTALITGAPGTPVTITLLENGKRHQQTLTRANLVSPVASSRLVTYRGTKLGWLSFTQFSQGSGAQLRTQVDKMLKAGAKGLILDLRDNGGGLLQQAIDVASIFIPDGTIVSTHGRTQPRQVYVAKGDAIPTSIPLVVLVNRNTASSSEIVTAALQDRGRAKVVGTHTYGKGVYQEIQDLPNGGALEITVGEFFTPSGRNLGGGGDKRGAGVTPNEYVSENTTGKVDDQLQAAEKLLASEVG